MKKLLILFFVAIAFSSCSEYQKALNGEDIAVKFKTGEALYEKGKYNKANKLFEQIVPSYRGKPQAEKLMYMYANSFLETKEYYLAGYQFERFATTYPKSEKVEEASFLAAKCSYMLSPIYSKEQHETQHAIEKFQLFINTFPESKYLPEANAMVKELDGKLEQKAYEIAFQYYNTAGFTRDYNAAIKAFDNFISEFPGSKLREEALYYRLESAYQLAINSVERKKQARLESAKKYYQSFVGRYTDSKFLKSNNKMLENIEEALKLYSTKS